MKKKNSPRIEFDVLTIFPGILDSYLGESLFKRAVKSGLVKVNTVNLRDFAAGKHRQVDDRPFGGGPGMVFKIEPIYKAVEWIKRRANGSKIKPKVRTILFSLRGKKLDGAMAKRLAKYDRLILICGRYEGVDERVAKHVADEEISIGDYVLSGGELPAMVLMEAVSRFMPGFLGKKESLEDVKGSFPAYTRPEIFYSQRLNAQRSTSNAAWRVPQVLLSGNHKKINEWRAKFGR